MVSRKQPRQSSSSQPRSTRAASTSRVPTFESWENVSDNHNAAPPARSSHNMERRAKSSMRYQSSVRASRPGVGGGGGGGNGDTPRASSGGGLQGHNTARPRAISASRVRSMTNNMMMNTNKNTNTNNRMDHEDPADVTRQILDLRERRESLSHSKRKNSPMPIRPNTHQQQPISPRGRVLKSSGSGISQEGIQAEVRLKRAENKITGLLDELEELKFFQELESEPAAANNGIGGPDTPRGPKTPRDKTPSQRSRDKTPSSRGGLHIDAALAQAAQVTQSKTPLSSRVAGIPMNIRTASPARNRRLPPPPPSGTHKQQMMQMQQQQVMSSSPMHAGVGGGGVGIAMGGAGGGLETYKPMSPRGISKLDRNSLELECQTLVRKMQIIAQERNSQAAMIEMYEISLQENDMDKAKVQKLESQLGQVSGELKRQLQNITKGKEGLIKDYEDKLQANLSKLHRVQEKADSYKMDLEVTKTDADRSQQDLEKIKQRCKDDKIRKEELKAREAVLELQLTEARNLNASLVKKVEQKRSEVTNLKQDLDQTHKVMQENERDRDQVFGTRKNALEQQLTMSKDRYNRLQEECTERNEEILEKAKELDVAHGKDADQTAVISSLQLRVAELEKETEVKYEAGKKASKTQETRKMQDLVAERANQTRESERRIKAMQEQLKHQADRHHAEIQETRKRNDEKLNSMREELKEEVRLQEGTKVSKLQSELSILRRNYEEAKTDYSTRLKEAQQKTRETASEFQRQDEVRQQELDHMHDRLESYINETGEKEARLNELSQQLKESRKKYFEETESMKTHHLAEGMKLDDQLEDQKQKFDDMEMKLTEQLETMKATYSGLERTLRNETADLRTELEEGHHKLAEAQTVAKESEGIKQRIDEVQNAFNNVQGGLQTERARHEEVESELRVELAKLEGKFRASESSLKMKKSRVQELEKQLDLATMTHSKVGEEKESAISSLRRQLEETSTRLENERVSVQEKDSAVHQMRTEIETLQDKLKTMGKLEDIVKDMKRRADSIDYEKTQKEAELEHMTKTYEETRHKLLEAEQRYTNVKIDIESHVDKREKLISRYDKSVQDLEFKLEKEREANSDLHTSISDLRRSADNLETEKIRKETELANLRKDYNDLSGLLEENLHSSAKKDELDLELRRKQREMSETVDIYNQNVIDLETKVKLEEKTKGSLQSRISQLQNSLDKVEDEKIKLSTDVTHVRQKYENAISELEEFQQRQEHSKGGIEAELGRKDRQIREAVQRYTRTIAELESKLEEESQSKLELDDRLASARSELEDKQKQTQELIQKNTKSTVKLESDLRSSALEKEELRARLEQTEMDLDQKRKELTGTVAKYSNEFADFQNVKQQHNEYRETSQSTREELDRKEKQINEMQLKIPELLSDLDRKSRESNEHKATAKRFETELSKRKDQLNEVVARYTDQIAELEAELDEHSVARSTTQDKVQTVKAEASRKDQKIKGLQKTVDDLESRLETANRNRDAAKQKADDITRELDEKESFVRKFEMEKIELETKLHTHGRSKDEMRTKVTELSSRLERKEREVREVTDRYKMYVMELESKLDQDTDAKHELQIEVDRLKSNLNSAAAVSSEASELRDKIYSLENAVENYRGKARDAETKVKDTARSLEERLEDASNAKEELLGTLKKAQGEKAEVIAALEGVINEVQNREDEIESLSDLLHRRDEELQHAKIIATKALQSAKDIQKRYKDKEKGVQSDLIERVDELSDNIDTLTSKNDTLQRKISMLERELRDKNLECKRLKDQLRQIDASQLRDPIKDDGSAFTHSTYSSTRADSFPNPASSGSMRSGGDLRISTDAMGPEGMGIDSDSFSPATSPRSPADDFGAAGIYEKEVEFPAFEKNPSGELSDAGSSTISTSDAGGMWSNEYDNESRGSGVESYTNETLGNRSRRSIERDALRKYVRQRYMAKR